MATKVIIHYPDPVNDPDNFSWVKEDNVTPVVLTTNFDRKKLYDDAAVDLPQIVSNLNSLNPGLGLYSGNPSTPPPRPF